MKIISEINNNDLQNKIALVRVDFNVPIKDKTVQDLTRILRTLPTIQYLTNANAKVAIISHFGRPKTKKNNLSLKHIVQVLSRLLNKKIIFINDCIGKKVQKAIINMIGGDVILLENLRFYKEEEQNDLNFAKHLSLPADIYVNDAFSCSHRAHASISRITEFLPSYAGFFLQNELKYLKRSISFNAKPITAIIGGAKIATKIKMLTRLTEIVDYLILCGAVANNFLLFNKKNIGKSLFQREIEYLIHDIIKKANKNNCTIVIPQDVLVAINHDFSTGFLKDTESILDNDLILDVGVKTLNIINNILTKSKSLLWNGPIGVFEHLAFSDGTIKTMKIVSNLTREGRLTSVIGGGDSLSAINTAGLTDKDFTYVSAAGGAFLTWLSGEEMPGLTALQRNLDS